MKLFLIDQDQLNALKLHATRLYSERRMGGDEMRDTAHALTAIVGVCEQLELPEPPPRDRMSDRLKLRALAVELGEYAARGEDLYSLTVKTIADDILRHLESTG